MSQCETFRDFLGLALLEELEGHYVDFSLLPQQFTVQLHYIFVLFGSRRRAETPCGIGLLYITYFPSNPW